MEWTKWPAISGLVLGTVVLSRSIPTTFAVDKPLLSSCFLIASSALSVIGASRLLPKGSSRTVKGQQYHALPLGEVGEPHSSRQPSPEREDVRYPASLRKLRLIAIALILALSLRVAVLRLVLANVQCAALTWEPLIPFAFACLDYWNVQRHKTWSVHEDPDSSAYDALEQDIARSPYRYLVSAGLVSFGGLLAIATTRSPASTYICAASLRYHWLTPFLQRLGTVLDIVIAYCIYALLHQQEGRGGRPLSLRFASVGWALLFSATFLFVIGVLYFFAFASGLERRLILEIPLYYVWSVLRLDVIVCFTIVCAFLAILHIGLTTASTLITFISTCTTTTAYAWNTTLAFPPMSTGLSFFVFFILLLGFAAYCYIETLEDKPHGHDHVSFNRVPSWIYLALLTLFLIRAGIWTSSSTSVNYHPIDLLIYDAQPIHEAYVNQSSASKTLKDAVKIYRQRYHRHPPPGFDTWYKYATERNSTIVDDFDSINRDLLPFYSLQPELIRQRTWQMISNPWHDAAGISIRAGKVDVSPYVVPTHRWMLDGILEMVGHFAQWLPDMDLAFNVNDECRIAVPFENPEQMPQKAANMRMIEKPANTFSEGRAAQWKGIPEKPNLERFMTEMSWQRTFHRFGNVGCHPGSPARNQRLWDVGRLCTSCTARHSMGAFLMDWTKAADICYQSDLADLHGVYISPAAFKGSHELYPIFSQSKVHGFNDILYPSSWNYIGKTTYAPNDEYPDVPYAHKNNSLFWRGATSEGVSSGKGQWKGMTRQRFLHLANDINGSGSPQTVLLPHNTSAYDRKLAYTPVPISDLSNLATTDVHIVDVIGRCAGIDCAQQKAEFGPLVPPVDFQSHWQYKFLLDLDGAGFSGRFLSFLRSRSLPFKAALFREWSDDRLTAWQHFVPLDLRGHGFWATLAYFAGLEGKLNGKDVKVEAHESQGERIAENGREWANKVLRKEDMEIYFFRLLLEWGRLTDDKRDSIGFSLDAG